MDELERLEHDEESEPMAVYVRPWPKDCGHCRMLCKDEDLNEHFCYVQDSLTKRIEDVNNKPDWCPLRPLPSPDGIVQETEYQKGFYDGFCDCLDAIMNEKKE